jgi:hypothetical protein
MNTYYRWQYGTYTLEEMQGFVSEDGADEGGTEGICACTSAADLIRNTVWADGKYAEGAEIVAFRGIKIEEIYDGVRAYPVEIIARYAPAEFRRMHEDEEID